MFATRHQGRPTEVFRGGIWFDGQPNLDAQAWGARVSAVDLYVGGADIDDVIVLRRVVMAPGPNIFTAVLEWLFDGTATGVWSTNYLDVVIAGPTLYSMIDRIISVDANKGMNDELDRLGASRGAFTDERRFWIKAIGYELHSNAVMAP
jgi:hypothetical protein